MKLVEILTIALKCWLCGHDANYRLHNPQTSDVSALARKAAKCKNCGQQSIIYIGESTIHETYDIVYGHRRK